MSAVSVTLTHASRALPNTWTLSDTTHYIVPTSLCRSQPLLLSRIVDNYNTVTLIWYFIQPLISAMKLANKVPPKTFVDKVLKVKGKGEVFNYPALGGVEPCST